MACGKNHRYLIDWSRLPDSQADTEEDRHICVGCAYVKGLEDGLNNRAKSTSLSGFNLPASQAGTGRHKDAMTAYIWGYDEGKRVNS